MKGRTLRAATLIFSLLSTTFLPLPAFAANPVNSQDTKKIYSARLGCMGCHQADSMESDSVLKQNKDNTSGQNQKYAEKTRK